MPRDGDGRVEQGESFSDIFDLTGDLNPDRINVIGQVAYFGGIPLTVAALSHLIKARNRKLQEQFQEKQNPEFDLHKSGGKAQIHPHQMEGEEFFNETDYELSKKRRTIDSELKDLLRSIEQEDELKAVIDADLGDGETKTHRTFDRQEIDEKYEQALNKQRETLAFRLYPEVGKPDSMRLAEVEYNALDPDKRANRVPISHFTDPNYKMFIQMLQKAGINPISANRRRDGTIDLEVSRPGGTKSEGVIKLPRMDSTAQASVLDPFVPATAVNLRKLENGVAAQNTVIQMDGALKSLRGGLVVGQSMTTLNSGAMQFAMDAVSLLRKFKNSNLSMSIGELSKAWSNLVRTSHTTVSETRDASNVRFATQVRMREDEAYLKGEMTGLVQDSSGNIRMASRREAERYAKFDDGVIRIRRNGVIDSYTGLQLLQRWRSELSEAGIKGEFDLLSIDRDIQKLAEFVGSSRKNMKQVENLVKRVMPGRRFAVSGEQFSTVTGLSASQANNMNVTNPYTLSSIYGNRMSSIGTPEERPERPLAAPWSKRDAGLFLNDMNALSRERVIQSPEGNVVADAFEMRIETPKPGRRRKRSAVLPERQSIVSITVPGSRERIRFTIESQNSMEHELKKLAFGRFMDKVSKTHRDMVVTSGNAAGTKFMQDEFEKLIGSFSRTGRNNRNAIAALKRVQKKLTKELDTVNSRVLSRVTNNEPLKGVKEAKFHFSDRTPLEHKMSLVAMDAQDVEMMRESGAVFQTETKNIAYLAHEVAQSELGVGDGQARLIRAKLPGGSKANQALNDIGTVLREKNLRIDILRKEDGSIDKIAFRERQSDTTTYRTIAEVTDQKDATRLYQQLEEIQRKQVELTKISSASPAGSSLGMMEIGMLKGRDPVFVALQKDIQVFDITRIDILEGETKTGSIQIYEGNYFVAEKDPYSKRAKQETPLSKNTLSIEYIDRGRRNLKSNIYNMFQVTGEVLAGSLGESGKMKHYDTMYFQMANKAFSDTVAFMVKNREYGRRVGMDLTNPNTRTPVLRRILTHTMFAFYEGNRRFRGEGNRIISMSDVLRKINAAGVWGSDEVSLKKAGLSAREISAFTESLQRSESRASKFKIETLFDRSLKDPNLHTVALQFDRPFLDNRSFIGEFVAPSVQFHPEDPRRSNTPVDSSSGNRSRLNVIKQLQDSTDQVIKGYAAGKNDFAHIEKSYGYLINNLLRLPTGKAEEASRRAIEVNLMQRLHTADEKARAHQNNVLLSNVVAYQKSGTSEDTMELAAILGRGVESSFNIYNPKGFRGSQSATVDRRMLALMSSQNPIFGRMLEVQLAAANEWGAGEIEADWKMSQDYYRHFKKLDELKSGNGNMSIKRMEASESVQGLYNTKGKVDRNYWKKYKSPFLNNHILDPSDGDATVSLNQHMVDTERAGAGRYLTLRGVLESIIDSQRGTEAFESGIARLTSDANKLFGLRTAFDRDFMEAFKKMNKFLEHHGTQHGRMVQLDLSKFMKFDEMTRGEVTNTPIQITMKKPNAAEINSIMFELVDEHGIIGRVKKIEDFSQAKMAFNTMSLIAGIDFVSRAEEAGELNARDGGRVRSALFEGFMTTLRLHSDHINSGDGSGKHSSLNHKLMKQAMQGTFNQAMEFQGVLDGGYDSETGKQRTRLGVKVGHAMMDSDTAMSLLLGGSHVRKQSAAMFRAHKFRMALKGALGISDSELESWSTPEQVRDKVRELTQVTHGQTKAEKAEAQRRGRRFKTLIRKAKEFMQKGDRHRSDTFIEDFIKYNSMAMHTQTGETVSQMVNMYRRSSQMIRDIKAGTLKHTLMAFRQPVHVGNDFNPLRIQIQDNLDQFGLDASGRIFVSGEDIRAMGGDQDGDLLYFLGRGYQTLFDQKEGARMHQALEDVRANAEHYLQRTLLQDDASNTRGFRPYNYESQKKFDLVLKDFASNQAFRLKNIGEAIDEDIDNYARYNGLNKTEKADLKKMMNQFLLKNSVDRNKAFYMDETFKGHRPEEAMQNVYEIEREHGSGNFRHIKQNDTLVNYRRVFDFISPESREMREVASRKDKAYEEMIRDYIHNLGGDVTADVEARRRLDTHRVVQKSEAGTMFKWVASQGHMLDIAFKNRDMVAMIKKVFGDREELKGKQVDHNFIRAIQDDILKESAEQLSLQAKHGAPNIVESMMKKLNQLPYMFDVAGVAADAPVLPAELNAQIRSIATLDDIDVELRPEDVTGTRKSRNMKFPEYQEMLRNRIKALNAFTQEVTKQNLVRFEPDGGEHGLFTLSSSSEWNKANEGLKKLSQEELQTKMNEFLNNRSQSVKERPGEMRAHLNSVLETLSSRTQNKADVIHAALLRDIEVLKGTERIVSKFKALDPLMIEALGRIQTAIRHSSEMREYQRGFERGYDFLSGNSGVSHRNMQAFLSKGRHADVRRKGFMAFSRMGQTDLTNMFGNVDTGTMERYMDTLNRMPYEAREGYGSALRNFKNIGKSAAIGTFVALGLNHLLGGYSIPDLAQTEGLGGEHWEKLATKTPEMNFKPRAPLVEMANPGYVDRQQKELLYRRINDERSGIPIRNMNREQDYSHQNYAVKIR